MPMALAHDAPGVVWPEASGRATISAPYRDSTIAIGISRRTAGAIDSLTWRGRQFINANDHGRELQSASSFGGKGECFNPTEAGAAADGTGKQSTSKLLYLGINDRTLTTKSLMAYWLGPGSRAGNCHGTESTLRSTLSDDILTKRVTIGDCGLPNVIRYEVAFGIPEERQQAGFEIITGYMMPEFREFWAYNLADNSLSPQKASAGNQDAPLIVSTTDNEFALGVVSPQDGPDRPASQHLYAHWDFTQPPMASPTTKWNSYSKFGLIAPGNYAFTTYLLVGSLDDVRSGMRHLRECLTKSGDSH